MATDDKARVTMLWPEDLKEAVRERVGSRGLTEFAIEAVRAKLGTHDAHKADSKELNEVKFLAQSLADTIAMATDYEDPASQLRVLDLPDWISTEGWPEHLQDVVPVEDSTPEPAWVAEDEEDGQDDEDLHRPMFMAGAATQAPGSENAPGGALEEEAPVEQPPNSEPGLAADLPHDTQSNDLLAKIRDKAAAMGITSDEFSIAGLKPASQVAAPRAVEIPDDALAEGPRDPEAFVAEPQRPRQLEETVAESPTEPLPELPESAYAPDAVELPPAEPATEPAPSLEVPAEGATSDACPKCGSELVAGECWECM